MTITALACRFTMACRFANGNTAIMAEGTGIKGISMGKGSTDISPGYRWNTVTIFTDIGGIGMAG